MKKYKIVNVALLGFCLLSHRNALANPLFRAISAKIAQSGERALTQKALVPVRFSSLMPATRGLSQGTKNSLLNLENPRSRSNRWSSDSYWRLGSQLTTITGAALVLNSDAKEKKSKESNQTQMNESTLEELDAYPFIDLTKINIQEKSPWVVFLDKLLNRPETDPEVEKLIDLINSSNGNRQKKKYAVLPNQLSSQAFISHLPKDLSALAIYGEYITENEDHIESMKAITQFKSIQILEITDLYLDIDSRSAFLSELSNLSVLRVCCESLDLSTIAGLKSLQVLENSTDRLVGQAQPCRKITNFSALSELNSLKSLNLRGLYLREDELKDNSDVLAGLKDLRSLTLDSFHYSGNVSENSSLMRFISNATHLTKLSLSMGAYAPEINDISALRGLVNLRILSLGSVDSKIDFGSLSDLDSLETLSFSNWPRGTHPLDIAPISHFQNIKELNISLNNDGHDDYLSMGAGITGSYVPSDLSQIMSLDENMFKSVYITGVEEVLEKIQNNQNADRSIELNYKHSSWETGRTPPP